MRRSASGSTRMLFQSGSRMTFMNYRSSGPWTSCLDRLRRKRPELLEVLPEHVRQLRRLRVVGAFVLPGVPRTQHVVWHVLDPRRNRQAEDGIGLGGGLGQVA